MDYIPLDITIEEHRKHIEYIRSLTGEQRALIAFEKSDKERQKLIGEIKKENPEFTKQQFSVEIIRRCYGEKLAQEVAIAKGWK